jgi:hypothetical protein
MTCGVCHAEAFPAAWGLFARGRVFGYTRARNAQDVADATRLLSYFGAAWTYADIGRERKSLGRLRKIVRDGDLIIVLDGKLSQRVAVDGVRVEVVKEFWAE